MKRTIITVNDGDQSKILHIPAQTVTDEKEARSIIKDLIDSLPENGVGLAAPQVGYNKRVFIVREGKNIHKFINPKLLISPAHMESALDSEGCLSIPGKMFLVRRYKKIEVVDEEGKRFFVDENLARIIQHEFDHLAGLVIDESGKEIEV